MVQFAQYVQKEGVMETVTVAEARRKLADLVAQVGFGGKRVMLERHGKPVAAVVSVDDLRRLEELDRVDDSRQKRALGALEAARKSSELIFRERNGEYLPDSAEVIREIREERTDELVGG
jgi:prevent-host-death family protein